MGDHVVDLLVVYKLPPSVCVGFAKLLLPKLGVDVLGFCLGFGLVGIVVVVAVVSRKDSVR